MRGVSDRMVWITISKICLRKKGDFNNYLPKKYVSRVGGRHI